MSLAMGLLLLLTSGPAFHQEETHDRRWWWMEEAAKIQGYLDYWTSMRDCDGCEVWYQRALEESTRSKEASRAWELWYYLTLVGEDQVEDRKEAWEELVELVGIQEALFGPPPGTYRSRYEDSR